MQAMTIEDVLKATGGTLLSGDIHQTFNDVISDSRKVTAGVLFVPLVGEKFDGHEFIKAAFDLGASAVLTQRDTELLVDKTIVKVEDTLKAFGDIAKYYKQKYNVPTVSAVWEKLLLKICLHQSFHRSIIHLRQWATSIMK